MGEKRHSDIPLNEISNINEKSRKNSDVFEASHYLLQNENQELKSYVKNSVIKCIFCDKTSKKSDRSKFSLLEENRRSHLHTLAKNIKNKDLMGRVESVPEKDLYCHKNCARKFELESSKNKSSKIHKFVLHRIQKKNFLFHLLIPTDCNVKIPPCNELADLSIVDSLLQKQGSFIDLIGEDSPSVKTQKSTTSNFKIRGTS